MDAHWDALATAIAQRRKVLRYSQLELAKEADVSRATVQKLESATGPGTTRKVLTAIEQALNWLPGSIDAILAGGEPNFRQGAIVGTGVSETGPYELHVSDLQGAARNGILATIPGATAAEILAAEQEIIAILRAEGKLPPDIDERSS
jgi:transcriptional regulator with XRE-family HTH domain